MLRFKHMLAAERDLWQRFLDKHEKEYKYFEYDVHVGEGETPPPEYEPQYKRMVKVLSQKRIDAIGYRDDGIYIFEIRPHAGLPSLGALLGYSRLYEKTFHPTLPTGLVIISDYISPDDTTLFAENGINVILV